MKSHSSLAYLASTASFFGVPRLDGKFVKRENALVPRSQEGECVKRENAFVYLDN
jgi:hypothetical protein